MAPGPNPSLTHVNSTTARPQLQPPLQSPPKPGASTHTQRHRSPSLPSAHSQQPRLPHNTLPTGPDPQPHPSQGPTPPQQHPSLSQAQVRQRSPSLVSAAPAVLTFQQQQKLLLQQQQQPHVYSQAPASLQHPQLQLPHHHQQQQQQQQQPPQMQLPQQQQQHQQWQVAQTSATQGQVRQQAETAGQPSRPSSASPPPGVPRIPQAQQQLLNLQQQLRLQRHVPQQLPQQPAHGSGVVSPHASRISPDQAHTLQQIQAVQSQLKGQIHGHSQGLVAAAPPQHSFSQDQGQGHLANGVPQVNFNPGQVRQGKPSAGLPQARSGQLPSFNPVRAEVSNGPRSMPVPAMRSPTSSISRSSAASPVKSGAQPSTLMTHMQASHCGPHVCISVKVSSTNTIIPTMTIIITADVDCTIPLP